MQDAPAPELLIFDWDGTLADSTPTIVEAYRAAFVSQGFPSPDETTIRYCIGLTVHESLRHFGPELSPQQVEELAQSYSREYRLRADRVELYPHTAALLQSLLDRGLLAERAERAVRGDLRGCGEKRQGDEGGKRTDHDWTRG